nr:bromo adjacent homology domain-containing 1 protein [Parasteatoda tepidariorum]
MEGRRKNDSAACPRLCYPSVQHKEGDIINERDCVLLKSGPKETDLPYVAKVTALWENPDDGEMMMSLLWYYRPEHTDQGRKAGQMEDEVFASRHKDVNSIACIEDKCYVLSYNEYCRYKASLGMDDDMVSLTSMLIPDLPDDYHRKNRLPADVVSSDIVFFCRHVYDFRQKRILKNPT